MPPPRRFTAIIRSFPKGINSDVDPVLIQPDQLSFAVNTTMRGTLAHQRPAFLNRTLSYDSDQTEIDFQAGLFQGAAYYRSPINGYIMCAVGGKLFAIAFSPNGAVLVSAITGDADLPNPDPSIPAAPAGVAAVLSGLSVSLSWTPSTGATSYTILRSTVNGSGYASVGTTSNASFLDTLVVSGITYYYVLQASNIAGSSSNSSQVSATIPNPAQIPDVPTGVSATSGTGQVSVFWSAAARATSYAVKRSVTSGSGYSTVGTTSSLSFTDTGVTNGVTYYYVVVAVNASGSSANSSQVTGLPVALQPPTQTTAFYAMNSSKTTVIGMAWLFSNVQSISGWHLYRSTSPTTGFSLIATTALNDCFFFDTGRSNAVTYYYKVAAINAAGEGPLSVVVSCISKTSNQVASGTTYATSGDYAGIYLFALQPGVSYSFGTHANEVATFQYNFVTYTAANNTIVGVAGVPTVLIRGGTVNGKASNSVTLVVT